MAEPDKAQVPQAGATDQAHMSLPTGYRQGIITAITVLLGFSLAFFRYWGLEASGKWTARSVVSSALVLAAVVLQLIALFRSLRLEDDSVPEYRKTVTWFIASAIALVLGLVFAVVEISGVLDAR
jgi:4-amino-4-deoxy-L-arabinose transferase-like glycosyltransferase